MFKIISTFSRKIVFFTPKIGKSKKVFFTKMIAQFLLTKNAIVPNRDSLYTLINIAIFYTFRVSGHSLYKDLYIRHFDFDIFFFVGSLFWMAPEIMKTHQNGRNPYTQASDMYAYGVVLFEIFAGELPYQNKNYLDPAMVIYMVGSGKMRPDLKRLNPRADDQKTVSGAKVTPTEIQELIERCFQYEPSARPSFIVHQKEHGKSGSR